MIPDSRRSADEPSLGYRLSCLHASGGSIVRRSAPNHLRGHGLGTGLFSQVPTDALKAGNLSVSPRRLLRHLRRDSALGIANTGREGIDERAFHLSMRLAW